MINHIHHYLNLLGQSQDFLMRTAAEFRQADETALGHIWNLTAEILPIHDIQRTHDEYDPVIGKKIEFSDNLLADGMVIATIFPEVRGTGLAGKYGMTGFKFSSMDEKGANLVKGIRNALHPDLIKSTLKNSYQLIKHQSLSITNKIVKKVGEIRLPQVLQPSYAGIGKMDTTIRDIFNGSKDTMIKTVGRKGSRSTAKNASIRQIDYLRDKYGDISINELHQRINLRGEVHQELNRLKKVGLSKSQRGPAVAGVLDKKTGCYYFGINDVDGLTPDIKHKLIKERIANMPFDLKEGYIKTAGAGSHAEVYALNKALLARPDADLNDLMVHVISARKINKHMPEGFPMPRCPHCEFITDGAHYIPEVLKYARK
ncbi:YwqJ-related putative deaminase [Scopulibacillus cellulosilyticus]|uniref:YwqJ-related putative deaminase n=1 Tax=Scopulibacillus cellulosilyticus TaxID=2665665 RepID=A0ABW2Q7Q8_9BACL